MLLTLLPVGHDILCSRGQDMRGLARVRSSRALGTSQCRSAADHLGLVVPSRSREEGSQLQIVWKYLQRVCYPIESIARSYVATTL